jgi:hypothetical protein
LTIAKISEIAAAADTRNRATDKILDEHQIGEKSAGGRVFTGKDLAELDKAAGPDFPPEKKLWNLVSALSQTERCELIAVMWIGRGDGEAEDLADLTNEASRMSDAGDREYITDKGPLGRYLRKGLEVLDLI